MHCYLLPSPSVFSLTCLVECSTLLFTNGDLYIFLLIAIFLCISLIKSQNILNILYIKNNFSFFLFARIRSFRHFPRLFHVENWQIQRNNSFPRRNVEMHGRNFQSLLQALQEGASFLFSAQTSSVTVLENITVLNSQLCDRQLYICSCTKS